jgi:hypothetical protein
VKFLGELIVLAKYLAEKTSYHFDLSPTTVSQSLTFRIPLLSETLFLYELASLAVE